MTVEQNDWVKRVLGLDFARAADPDGADEGREIDVGVEEGELGELGVDRAELWGTAVDGFRSATETVDGQITALQAALRETDDVDLHDIADSGLNAVTGNTRVPLLAALREAGTGNPAQLSAAKPKLLKAIANFRTQLGSAEIAACDNNPFDVEMSIADTYAAALDQLVYALKLAA